uniref:CEA cell adhesion molecule 18 n=1 Tax=Gorilla gorilla gorilla TaxID=9595 RepID=G3QCZ7_GORGO
MDLSRPRWSLRRRIFLMASLLACGICQASGQIFITQTLGIKGYRTVLALDNVPEDVQEYSWYWGANDNAGNMIISHKPPSAQQPGPMYTGRERVNREGSLLIRPTALNDTGNYTVRVVAGNETQRATGWLEVLELGSNPGISVNASSLVENMDSVAADCHTNVTNITWYVNDVPTSSSDRMTISPDGKTLVILRVSRHDRTIQCMIESFPEIFQRSEPWASYPVSTDGRDYVLLRSNPDDFNGIVTAEIGSQVEMECICYSFLDLKYHWIHNGSLLNFSDAKMNLSSLAWEDFTCCPQRFLHLSIHGDVPHHADSAGWRLPLWSPDPCSDQPLLNQDKSGSMSVHPRPEDKTRRASR